VVDGRWDFGTFWSRLLVLEWEGNLGQGVALLLWLLVASDYELGWEGLLGC
jgi:hypothetical protein